jgi:biopolymer transport protein ExbD
VKLTRRSRQEIAGSTASSDIAFLLIIYFLVIAGFTVNKGFILSLPTKDSTKIVFKDDLMRFDIDDSGRLWFQDSIISYQTAEQEIRTAVLSNLDTVVVLTVAPPAPWQAVVSCVELAQKLNIDKFSFKMREDIEEAVQ